MDDIKKSFEKEPQSKKIILIAAAAALVATFLPWFKASLGEFGALSVNGWHSYGFITVIGSAGLVLIWLLPKLGVKYKLPAKEDYIEKGLAIAIIAGPVLWLIDMGFDFSFVGLGLYLAVAAGGVATYFKFVPKKAKKTTKK
ncbi:hypothetical protein ACFL21_00445 [Patescibacteria group bacterium]